MAKEICAYCKHCKFTSVPEFYRGRGYWCASKGRNINPDTRKLFCRKFERKERKGYHVQ